MHRTLPATRAKRAKSPALHAHAPCLLHTQPRSPTCPAEMLLPCNTQRRHLKPASNRGRTFPLLASRCAAPWPRVVVRVERRPRVPRVPLLVDLAPSRSPPPDVAVARFATSAACLTRWTAPRRSPRRDGSVLLLPIACPPVQRRCHGVVLTGHRQQDSGRVRPLPSWVSASTRSPPPPLRFLPLTSVSLASEHRRAGREPPCAMVVSSSFCVEAPRDKVISLVFSCVLACSQLTLSQD